MNNSYRSTKLLRKKKRIRKVKIWCFVILVLILVAVFFWIMRHPNLNVDEIRIVNDSLSNRENLKASVYDSLSGSFLFLIPKTNVLVLPRQETEKNIKERFPEIETINLNLKNLNKIEVEVLEYEPKIIAKNEEGNFFVNKDGKIFMRAPSLHTLDSLNELVLGDSDLKIRQEVISPNFLSDLLEFIENLRKLEIEVSEIKNIEKNVYILQTDKNFEIRISIADDLKSAFENISTIIENDALRDTDLDNIEYIDLRFGNKVFYKLKE